MRRRKSLKFRIAIFCVFLGASLIILVGYNNYSAIRTIRQQKYETIRDTTYVQQSRISDNLSSIDNYLNSFVYNDMGIGILEPNQRNTVSWFSNLYNLQKNFNSAIQVHTVDNFFLYTPDSNLFITTTAGMGAELRSTLTEAISQKGFFNKENSGKWIPVFSEEKYYLARVIRVYNSYIGAAVSVDRFLAPLQGDAYQNLYFDIATSAGALLHSDAPVAVLEDYVENTKATYRFISVDKQPQLLITHLLPHTNLSLVILAPDASLQEAVSLYGSVIIIVLIGIVVIFFLFLLSVQIWIMQPVHSLTRAIQRLRQGDINVKVDANAFSTEFYEVNTVFNEMVAEIRNLKIDVYEQQIHRQTAEIEYLKLQVTPHFLVNCLNTVYQLTEAKQPELTLAMIKNLSFHLRYMLNSGSSVSLRKETILVENFIALSSIRYPECIRLYTDYEESTLNATAIPLLILNFVENTVKYEVDMRKKIEIHISIRKIPAPKERVSIQIWDTGQGFSSEMLSNLQDIHAFIELKKSTHIGISNVFQRAKLILGEECEFRFSNLPYAGAKIEIEIPYLPFEKRGEL